jgi:GABA(A) receptor-associated protein
VERAKKCNLLEIDRKKYLVPMDLTVWQFIIIIRKRVKLSPERALFLIVNNVIPSTSAVMNAVYEEQKSADGFLYMTYTGEDTFGLLNTFI